MATRFEFLLCGDDMTRLRAAGEEAISEIHRVEQQLSAFRVDSIVSRINRRGSEMPVDVPADVFRLFVQAHELSDMSKGAFDITVGPLLACWGFRRGEPRVPTDDAIGRALVITGFELVSLDPGRRSVFLEKSGMSIDLGGIGKGHALEVAATVLQSAGVTSALLHGGTSSVRAIGTDPEGAAWSVAVKQPFSEDGAVVGYVSLQDEALAVSATSGKYFFEGNEIYGHIIDPRSGTAVSGGRLTAVSVPSAVDADAMSTALLVLGQAGINHLAKHVDDFRGAVLAPESGSDGWTGVDTGDIWLNRACKQTHDNTI